MLDIRVVLIGGTSNVGKSTVADEVAAKLGFERLSTDSLARHPGRRRRYVSRSERAARLARPKRAPLTSKSQIRQPCP